MKTPIILSWSGGKDSALALFALRQSDIYEVRHLITTINTDFDRVSIHGVSRNIIVEQAQSIGLPISFVEITSQSTNKEYERAFCSELLHLKASGVNTVAYGDIFLQSLRDHREEMLAEIGMSATFPLWKKDTNALANEFIAEQFHGYICCIDDRIVPKNFCGHAYDSTLLATLPSSIDPCGENGEFHSIVVDGPIFQKSIPVSCVRTVEKPPFTFADIQLCNSNVL